MPQEAPPDPKKDAPVAGPLTGPPTGPLTDVKIRALKPRERAFKVFDPGCKGLHLYVTPAGGKHWRMRYWHAKREKRISLGPYPEIGLKDARQKVADLRKQLAEGVDPATAKKAEKAAQAAAMCTFESLALEWLGKFSANWSETYQAMVRDRLEKQLFPWLGHRPVGEITAPDLLAAVRRIESRGALELAHRCLQHCSAVFRYGVATGRAERDPAADLRGALPPVRAKHYAALTTPAAVGELMRAINGFQGTLTVRCALRLAPLVFVRPGELRQAEWTEFDLDAAEWRIPASKMKMRQPHLVPLSRQAVAILRELQPLTGAGRYVFPSVRTDARPMSNNTINVALRRLGYSKQEMTGHGFRSVASTLLNELGFKPDVIERQLAHQERNAVRAAYNFAEYIDNRREMMQRWADFLEGLAGGGQVIALRAGRSREQ